MARVANAVPVALCERLVSVLKNELGVPIHEPDSWDQYGRGSRDLIPIWGHQAHNGTFASIRIYIASGPHCGKLSAFGCCSIRVASRHRGTPVMANPWLSTGTTIRGMCLDGCFKAYLR